jgi:hypothetical protein
VAAAQEEGSQVTENRVLHSLHKVEVEPGEVGSTVRNGSKWANAVPGTKLDLCECASPCPAEDHVEERDCIIVGLGEVTDQWFGHFDEVPARLIEHEHEVRSRQYSGLLASMQKAYGDSFEEENFVTVIVYKRVS